MANSRVVREERRNLHPSRRSLDDLADQIAVSVHLRMPRPDLGVKRHHACIQSLVDLGEVGEGLALTWLAVTQQRQIVETQHDILRRHDDRTAIGRRQDVVLGLYYLSLLRDGEPGQGKAF